MLKQGEIMANRYKIIERIAYGAFSVAYKAFDEVTQKEICLKFETIEEGTQSMIKHEFLVAKSFNSPYLCQCYEFYDEHYKYISMELLGENLANSRRKRKNPPSIPMLMNITVQCLRCLNIMHERNYVHCDVKPSNFAFKISEDHSNYSIVLFDFGLSQYEGEDPAITEYRNNLVRNPRYLSLSTHKTKKWTKTDDIFALIYSLADYWKDQLPWDGRTTNNLVLEIKQKVDLKSLLPDELHVLVDCANLPTDQILQKVEQKFAGVNRNVEEELHYILDPKDPDYKPKFIKYVFEKGSSEKFTNKHSA